MNYHDLTEKEQAFVDAVLDAHKEVANYALRLVEQHIEDCLKHVIENHFYCNEFRVIEVPSMIEDIARNTSAFQELAQKICTLIDEFGAEYYPIDI